MSKHVKIAVPVDDETIQSEWVWGIPQPDGTYKVDNIPFFVNELNLGDYLRAERRADRLCFKSCERRSGFRTYRLLFPETQARESQKSVLREISEVCGAQFERANPRFIVAAVASDREEALFHTLDRLFREQRIAAWECTDNPDAWWARVVQWLGPEQADLWLSESESLESVRH